MDHYVSKPIDIQALSESLARISPMVRKADRSLEECTADETSAATASGKPSTYHVIDIEYARMRLGGCDDRMLAQLAEAMLEELPQRVSEIELGLKNSDAKLITHSARPLKGAAGNLEQQTSSRLPNKSKNSVARATFKQYLDC